MATRTGIPTLLNLATKLCRALSKFGVGIVLLYPTNTALLAALNAALAACGTLQEELAKVREIGD